jgi:ABC-type sugar transport system permease subunit
VGVLLSTLISVAVALGVVAGLFVLANLALDRVPVGVGERVRPWVFVGPAMFFLGAALVVPAVRTILLSFKEGKVGDGSYTLSNWKSLLQNKTVFSLEGAGNVLTSRLFLAGGILFVLGMAAAVLAATRDRGAQRAVDLSSPVASTALVLALIVVLLAIFSTLRGVIWNNLWWVASVAGFATLFGLGLAVLADRSRRETAAKTLIFLPMAISLVGSAVIWKYIYDTPGAGQAEGLLNVLLPGDPIDFVRGSTTTGSIAPWNNFFLMIIMIWIQTGFAMVVLSAAIKGVPTELQEAARVDGANEVQVFWKVVLPQIAPTILVVVTTLTITVLKIFDLVKATTGGAAGTDVLANRMYDSLRNGNFTGAASFATTILVLVLPVMWFNVRRTRKELDL